jgi:glycosyltransferase involved in cell wall biosynthesis
MITVSCIIPAYNEGKRIEGVLRAVYKHPLISEIIVVDDGSKDDIQEIMKNYPTVKLLINEKNIGKSKTLVNGIKHSIGEYLLFLDADLIGLTSEAISALINPVISRSADISISLRKNAPGFYRRIGLDFISGERVIPRSFIADHLEEVGQLARFGFETYLNKLIVKNNSRLAVVLWNEVISPWKHTKSGFWSGIIGEIKMNYDIARTASIFEIIGQISKMLKLRVKN